MRKALKIEDLRFEIEDLNTIGVKGSRVLMVQGKNKYSGLENDF